MSKYKYQSHTLTGLICMKCGESYAGGTEGFEQLMSGNCLGCEELRKKHRNVAQKVVDWVMGRKG